MCIQEVKEQIEECKRMIADPFEDAENKTAAREELQELECDLYYLELEA